MPRRKEPGSRSDKKLKRDLQVRSKEGLIALYNRLLEKIESGKYPRDEEIRFMKRFQELLTAAEAKEKVESKPEEELPEGKLREFIERLWKFKELGIVSREDEHKVLRKAGYSLCDFCGYWHFQDKKCPFKSLKAPSDS